LLKFHSRYCMKIITLSAALTLTCICAHSQNLIGYIVIGSGNERVGSISEIIPNNGQWLLNVISPDRKNILIPFHEHFILRIDRRKKIVVMDIPEGLLEIN